MRSARSWVMMAISACAATGAAAQGEGLVPSGQGIWPRWQARLSLSSPSLLATDPLAADARQLAPTGASLLGDYYFSRWMRDAGNGGGFRATSGVFLGARSSLLGAAGVPTPGIGVRSLMIERRSASGLKVPESSADPAAVPYLGIGYSGITGKGGWGFSADVGLMAFSPGSAVKLGRVFTGSQSLDNVLHDMRLSPLVQLGISYSF